MWRCDVNLFGVDKSTWTATSLLRLPPEKRQTFEYATPGDTHYRQANCKEAAERGLCKHYAEGFVIPWTPGDLQLIDVLNTLGYSYSLTDIPPEHLQEMEFPTGTKFLVFPPEQRCLTSYKVPHRISLEREPLLRVVGGDWRGNPRGDVRTHDNLENWVDDLHNTTDKIRTEIEKG